MVRTPKRKRRIDITQAPYLAKGDGKALNTAAIQQAIEDCKEDEMVYVPAGTFLTGALTLHDHMELYLRRELFFREAVILRITFPGFQAVLKAQRGSVIRVF